MICALTFIWLVFYSPFVTQPIDQKHGFRCIFLHMSECEIGESCRKYYIVNHENFIIIHSRHRNKLLQRQLCFFSKPKKTCLRIIVYCVIPIGFLGFLGFICVISFSFEGGRRHVLKLLIDETVHQFRTDEW